MLGLLLENFHHLLTTILWNILTLSLSFNIVNSKFCFYVSIEGDAIDTSPLLILSRF